jgi:hypothetical protein
MQATCFGSLEPSSGLYLYLNTDPILDLRYGKGKGLMMAQASRNM